LDTADGEVELLRRNQNLELRSEGDALSSHVNYKDRTPLSGLVLTTHRLVFSTKKESRFLHLSNVHAAENVPTKVFSSHCKIRVSTYSLGELIVVGAKKESILPDLEKSLERRAWETASRLQEAKKQSAVSKRRVGVDAIMAQNKRKHERASQVTEQAFTGDAETLMREATELVAIIQKYSATLSSTKDHQEQDTSQLSDMLQDMGMASALPSATTSSDYYETLARQLADFLSPKLEKTGGIMTLTDVYCLYNRARGSNLISPDDLLKAVECFNHLQLSLRVKKFPSQVKVIMSSLWDEDEIARKLLAKTPLTALQASRELKMSVLLANEALLAAERKGYLCRDVTLETTRFFPNRFEEFSQKP
jgi:ESCRT-II complex subunit VPS36